MTVAGSAGGYTYTSNTPSICQVNAAGKIAAYDVGTCSVTVSQAGYTSDTKSITVANGTQAGSSCAFSVPVGGDKVTETSGNSLDNEWGMARDISLSAPDNPAFYARVPVTYSYNYAAAGGGATTLTTSLIGPAAGLATSAIPLKMPANNSNGNTTTSLTSNIYNAYVPLPVPTNMTGPAANLNPGRITSYAIDNTGAITTANYWQPKQSSKSAYNDPTVGVVEFYPANWQAQIASQLAGKAVGTSSTAFRITRRSTGGGQLTSAAYSSNGGSVNKASFTNNYYTVVGTLVSNTASKTVPAGTATGQVTYTNLCKITYTMTRVGVNSMWQTATDPGADPNAAGVGTYGTSGDTSAVCTGNCSGLGGKNSTLVANAYAEAIGDFKGTFYSSDKLPRAIYTSNTTNPMADDNFHALVTIGGVNDTSGGGTNQQPNSTYWSYKDRTDGTNNHTYYQFNTTDVVRDWIQF